MKLIDNLVNGFAVITDRNVSVREIRINPTDYRWFEKTLLAEDIGYSPEENNPTVAAHLWGALIILDGMVPAGFALIVSEPGQRDHSQLVELYSFVA